MKLNTEKINELTDRIEQCNDVDFEDHVPSTVGLSFAMLMPFYRCGAPACMLGHYQNMNRLEMCNTQTLATDLGLSVDQVDELTAPQHAHADFESVDPNDPGYITKRRAVAVLRNLASTGEVNWSIRE